MTLEIAHNVRFRAESPTDSFIDQLPDSDDPDLFGVEKTDGGISGSPPREYRIAERETEDGEIVLDGWLPFEDREVAEEYADTIIEESDALVYLRAYTSPLGAIRQSDLEAYFEANPDDRPEDEDGEPYIPSQWPNDEFVIAEYDHS